MKFFYSKYSFIVTVSFSAIVAASMWELYSESLSHLGLADFSNNPPIMKAYDYSYSDYDTNGILETFLEAEYVEQLFNKDVSLEKMHVETFEKDGFQNWDLRADNAYSKNPDDESKPIRIYNNVKGIMYSKPNNKKQAISNIHIDTQEIYYIPKSGDFYNDKFVKVYDPKKGNNTTGIGASGNSQSKNLTIKKDVRSYYASR